MADKRRYTGNRTQHTFHLPSGSTNEISASDSPSGFPPAWRTAVTGRGLASDATCKAFPASAAGTAAEPGMGAAKASDGKAAASEDDEAAQEAGTAADCGAPSVRWGRGRSGGCG